jgi:hypothetical protein
LPVPLFTGGLAELEGWKDFACKLFPKLLFVAFAPAATAVLVELELALALAVALAEGLGSLAELLVGVGAGVGLDELRLAT